MPGEGNGNGNGNGNGDGNGAAGDVKQQLADLQTKMGALEQDNKSLKDAKVDLEQKLDDADKELLSDGYLNYKDKAKDGGGNGGGDTKVEGEIDLDRASSREIAQFIEKKYKGDMGAAVKEISARITKGEERLALTFAQIDVTMTAIKHNGGDGKPSFTENQKAIFEVAKANPTWGAEKCYQQWLMTSKASADAKADADKKKKDDEDRANAEKSGVPDSVVQGKRLTKEEAATLAYKKAFGNEGEK